MIQHAGPPFHRSCQLAERMASLGEAESALCDSQERLLAAEQRCEGAAADLAALWTHHASLKAQHAETGRQLREAHGALEDLESRGKQGAKGTSKAAEQVRMAAQDGAND